MIQTVDGKEGYVVEFDDVPALPITYAKDEEKPYALALAAAIHTKQITEPGKYMLVISDNGEDYEIFTLTE